MIELVVAEMTAVEARALVREINAAIDHIGRSLLELRDRRGFVALGYSTFTACLEQEFRYTRQHLYELMRAAPVQERLSGVGYSLSVNAAAELSRYPLDSQAAIASVVRARDGKVTEAGVAKVGPVLSELIATGYVDTGNGTGSKFELALVEQEAERVLAARAIAESPRQQPVCVEQVTARRLSTGQTALVVDTALTDGVVYRVVVYPLRVTPAPPTAPVAA